MRKITFLVIATILFGMSSFISQSEAKPLRSQKAVQSGIDMTYPVYVDGALVHNNQDGSESTPTKTNKKQKKRNKGEYLIASPAGEEGSGRPQGCPSAYCGCWLSLKIYNQNIRRLWVALNWKNEGQASSPGCIGCIAVMTRKGGGHVGIVIGYNGKNPILLSGNHNRRVAVGEYPIRRIVAFRSL